ncbi:ATP-binding protein [Streptomonospora salina]|uniref:Anti-sigma regulatory factor (Ser/Thr protein kinase) n=1 Tax=Streptomonospora salina TaxID=104205 RepID=A0A841E6W7_9ACTN|nr:ATP-binding protein [Streptomonospora salina]MBB5999677.1 anti-sigma regulatory factor (Ser/Thr protein kinase) [Streptomonospora salina]
MSDSQRLREHAAADTATGLRPGARGRGGPEDSAEEIESEAGALEASEDAGAATDHTVWSCVGNLTAVRSIRARVREFLERSKPPQNVLDDAELASSELATNALLHSRSGQTGGVMTLFIRSGRDRVRVAVADQGEKNQAPDSGDTGAGRTDTDDYGRGKLIIESCTTRSGEYLTDTTHVAWFEIDIDDGA